MRQFTWFCALLWALPAAAGVLPLTAVDLNPKLKLTDAADVKPITSPDGFKRVFRSGDFEVTLRGTRMQNLRAARQMSEVGFANVLGMYAPRGNPYIGQITDLVQCDAKYKPQEFTVTIAGQTARALTAAATSRKMFGACATEQIGYWAAYMSFYLPSDQFVLEVRAFEKADHPKPAAFKKLNARLKAKMNELFVAGKAAQP